MTTKIPDFLTYAEAIIAARHEPNVEFLGLRFEAPYRHLSAYTISADTDEPDEINVDFSGGELFSFFGEEDFFSESDVPDDAKTLFYARFPELGNGKLMVMGITSEHVLFSVLPELKEPDTYHERSEFSEQAGQVFQKFWRQA